MRPAKPLLIAIVMSVVCVALLPVVSRPTPSAGAASPCVGNGLYDQTAKRGRTPQPDADGHVFPLVTIHGITGTDQDFDNPIDKSYIGAQPQPPRSLLDAFAGPQTPGQTLPPGLPGVHVYSFSYTPDSLRWIDDARVGPKFAAAIDCLYEAYGEPVSVVAHSMGGLVTRWVANTTDAAGVPRSQKLGKVVTLGTPYLGSLIAALGLGIEQGAGAIPNFGPIISALTVLCGDLGTQTGKSSCGVIPMLSALDSEAGHALAAGSAKIKALARWPAGTDVAAIAGSIKVPFQLLGSRLKVPVDIGDFAGTTESATNDPGPARVFDCRYDTPGDTARTQLLKVLGLASPEERFAQLQNLFLGSPCAHSSLMRNVELTNEVLGQLNDWLTAHRVVGARSILASGSVPEDCRVRDLVMYRTDDQDLVGLDPGDAPGGMGQTHSTIAPNATILLKRNGGLRSASRAELAAALGATAAVDRFLLCGSPNGWRWLEPASPGRPLRATDRLRPDGIGVVTAGMTYAQAEVALGQPIAVTEDQGDDSCVGVEFVGAPQPIGGLGGDGRLRRIDVYESPWKTSAGIGIGSTEAQVHAAYPNGLTVDTHPYNPDGHYLVYTPVDGSASLIIFETDGATVTDYRVGEPEFVRYIEGCS